MKALYTEKAPKPVGSYSQAIVAGDLIFCSGQIGLDPATGQMVPGGVRAECERALTSLTEVLKEAEATLSDVVSVTLYLRHMEDYAAINDLYAQYFSTIPQPSRVTVEVSKLPKDALVEVSCVAHRTRL